MLGTMVSAIMLSCWTQGAPKAAVVITSATILLAVVALLLLRASRVALALRRQKGDRVGALFTAQTLAGLQDTA